MTRVRDRHRDWPLSYGAYWVLRRASPYILLIAMAASGLLFVRATLVWGDNTAEHAYGADIPLAAATVVACALPVVLLHFVPSRATARLDRPLTRSRTVVVGLGSEWRIFFLIAVPVCGLLGAAAPLAIPTALGANPNVSANLWFGLPLAVLLTAGSVAILWSVARGILHGVELTPSHVVARGFFLSRAFRREDIVEVRIVDVSGLPWLLSMLMRMPIPSTVRITTADGTRRVLYAASAKWDDMARGVEVIRAWTDAGGTEAP